MADNNPYKAIVIDGVKVAETRYEDIFAEKKKPTPPVEVMNVDVNVLHDEGTVTDNYRHIKVVDSDAGDDQIIFAELGEFLAGCARVAYDEFSDFSGLDLTITLPLLGE